MQMKLWMLIWKENLILIQMYNALIMHMNILVEDISVVKINMDVQEIRKTIY